MKDGLKRVEYAEGKGFLSPIDEIIDDLRNGRMIILVDAEDRENEGDLVVPAQMATPDAINFMAKHGRGLVCLSLTQQRADQLRLEYMARHNEARNRTAFTVSIEAREGIATGISAHDRARTIATAIDPTKDPQRHRLARPRVPADRARGRRAGPRRPHRGERRSGAARRPLPGRRHLRDHERRRHHGAHAGPRRLRPAARPQDRHHRGPDRLPPAARPHRHQGGEPQRRDGLRRPLRVACLRDQDGAGRAPGPGQGRPVCARPGAGARARRAMRWPTCSASAPRARPAP